MEKPLKQKQEIAYVYTRDGVEFITTNEQLASKRTDTGNYTVIYDDETKNISKESE